jgi:E3 ubiquitin-protein ligase RNF14
MKDLVSMEQFERWETLLLTKTLERMPDMVYCPRCELATLKEGNRLAQCTRVSRG